MPLSMFQNTTDKTNKSVSVSHLLMQLLHELYIHLLQPGAERERERERESVCVCVSMCKLLKDNSLTHSLTHVQWEPRSRDRHGHGGRPLLPSTHDSQRSGTPQTMSPHAL